MRRSILTTAICASLLTLTGCAGGGSDSAPTTSSARPAVAQPAPATTRPPVDITPVDTARLDWQDPEAVAVAALEAIYTISPGVDGDGTAAYERAAPLLTARVLDSVRAITSPTGQDPQWDRWAQQGAIITAQATVLPQEHPADTDRAYRYMQVRRTVHTSTADRAQTPINLQVGLVHTDSGWALDVLRPA